MMKMGIIAILLLLGFNLKSQDKTRNIDNSKLTALSAKILDMFIDDPMNNGRIDSLSCSIVLSFGDTHDFNNELWIYDAELLSSCVDVDHIYLAKYKGFNIFYNGKILSKYIYKSRVATKVRCLVCDSMLNKLPKGERILLKEYDGSIYKIKRGTTIKNIKIEKVVGG